VLFVVHHLGMAGAVLRAFDVWMVMLVIGLALVVAGPALMVYDWRATRRPPA